MVPTLPARCLQGVCCEEVVMLVYIRTPRKEAWLGSSSISSFLLCADPTNDEEEAD